MKIILNILIAFLINCNFSASSFRPTLTHAQLAITSTIIVPDSYLTIQEALNVASQGDTVFVRSGTYYEMVNVNKSLSLIGENKETTFIYGNRIGSVVQIYADNVTVSGFVIENRRAYGRNGVGLNLRNGCSISGNIFANNYYGIGVFGCSNVNVTGNIMIDNQYGFAGDSCSNCHITRNNITHCWDAIGIDDSSNIEISENYLSDNQAYGIVSDFPLSNNHLADNNITRCGSGIYLHFLSDNNETGNIVAGNTISENQQYGIYFQSSSNTLVNGNNIMNNGVGIVLSYSWNNSIYHNNFINNIVQTSTFPPNVWDDGYPSGGNYWSNHNPPDEDLDMIGDIPKTINDNNIDMYPLIYPYGFVSSLDLNHDEKIDMYDIGTVARAFGSYPGHSRWKLTCDINVDEKVDMEDVGTIAREFGKSS